MSSPHALSFTAAKNLFDVNEGKGATLSQGIVTVGGKIKTDISIRNSKGEPNEEFYKWQFLHALVDSGLYEKDYIGTEVSFPKGNKTSASLRMDAAIFDSPDWLDRYLAFLKERRSADLEWLKEHLIATIEFKNGDREIEKVVTGQVKSAMNEKDPSTAYVFGMYYDAGRLYLFHRKNGNFLRYNSALNGKREASKIGDLNLHQPDPYLYIPSFEQLQSAIDLPATLDRTKRGIADLDTVSELASQQMQDALSDILRRLTQLGLFNQTGYRLFIETLATKIYDERRNEKYLKPPLAFYITDDEAHFKGLADAGIQSFIQRVSKTHDEAREQYKRILKTKTLNWKDENHVRAVVAIVQAFQDYSFQRSSESDLYQIVFYNFANEFSRAESAQFLTPLPVIRFLVSMVNPRDGESVFDPCCGIGDFLSLSFVHSRNKADGWRLDDANIYGVDNDGDMITLATLNMLLNGDGEAKLFHKPHLGSIEFKVESGNNAELTPLLPNYNARGAWDERPDQVQLKKFNVVLTNPPFGEDRAFRPTNAHERDVIETYQTWHLARKLTDDEDATKATARGRQPKGAGKSREALDMGVIFLENAVHSLAENGRLGIVLSNSIASINGFAAVRDWLMERLRLVALIDLPPNIFAETGVNTAIFVAYKPPPEKLAQLNKDGYDIFVRDIQNVGYEKRTSKRNVFFNDLFKINETTFEVEIDENGRAVKDEDFSHTLGDFKQWANRQESALITAFLKED